MPHLNCKILLVKNGLQRVGKCYFKYLAELHGWDVAHRLSFTCRVQNIKMQRP